jgi:sugar phosphate isomerase/epimerase
MACYTDEWAQKVLAALEKHGVSISTVWCGWSGKAVWNAFEGPLTLGIVPPFARFQRILDLKAGSDFAKKLGVNQIATHAGFIPEDPNTQLYRETVVALREIAAYCKKNGQYLLFETGQETPVTLVRCFEMVMNDVSGSPYTGLDNLGINLDTANCILYGRANPVDALDVFGKYVRNLHAKDGRFPVNGHDLGEETKIGEGKVDFEGVIKGLHDLGYNRYITIEREISGDQQLKDILESREYLESIIAKVYKD